MQELRAVSLHLSFTGFNVNTNDVFSLIPLASFTAQPTSTPGKNVETDGMFLKLQKQSVNVKTVTRISTNLYLWLRLWDETMETVQEIIFVHQDVSLPLVTKLVP